MIPVIGFVGYSGSGKTTLATRVTQIMQNAGQKIAVIKHDPHGHYKEINGTDTALYRESGASAVILVAPNSLVRWESFVSPNLDEVIKTLQGYDCIFVEGYKRENHPKIAVIRAIVHQGIIQELDPQSLIAIASIPSISISANVPVLDINQPEDVAAFIRSYIASAPIDSTYWT